MIWGRFADAEASDADEGEGAPVVSEGDPAQALLNVLSRFQRHYLRGKDGTSQREWSDDCMNSLIDAVDVAIAQRWQEVVSVLTETARVLQTYEDAERANECVPFLTSSHELLCHMVGDLLTGQIRPGLMRKWDSLYDRVRAEVDAAGLELVQDEVSDEELVQEAFGVGDEVESPFEEPSSVVESQVANGEPESVSDEPEPPSPFELPELSDDATRPSATDDLPDLADPGTAVAYEEESDGEDDEGRILSFPGRAAEVEEDSEPELEPVEDAVGPDSAPFELPLVSEPREEAEESDSLDSALESHADETEPVAVAPDSEAESDELVPELDPTSVEPEPVEIEVAAETLDELAPEESDISGILDAACDALSNVHENLESFRSRIHELETRADESEWEGASAASRSVLRLMDMLESRNIEPTDRFLELAYGFSGVYVESRDSVDTEEYRSFQKDCVALLQDWMDDRATERAVQAEASEPERVETATPDAGLDDLLNTVRAAMEGGRAANAKLLMLEAAARIAREQELEAEAQVSQAERALSENTRALEVAREGVHTQETLVSETAARVTEVQHSQEAHRRQMSQLAERLEESLSRVESLDEQIRELQNRREAADSDRAAAQEALDGARSTEEEHEATLEAAREEERNARLRLEVERREAKGLQSGRGDLERAVIAQRESLARQRQSTQDIETTIAHIRDAEPGETSTGDESLF